MYRSFLKYHFFITSYLSSSSGTLVRIYLVSYRACVACHSFMPSLQLSSYAFLSCRLVCIKSSGIVLLSILLKSRLSYFANII